MTDHDIAALHGTRDHLDRGQPATDRVVAPLTNPAGLAKLRGEVSRMYPHARPGSPNDRHRLRLLDLIATAEQEQSRLTTWVLTLGGDAEHAEALAANVITIPRPAIYTGPKNQTVDQNTVSYLRKAARRVRDQRYWGSGVTALISDLLDNAAAAIDGDVVPEGDTHA